MQGEYSGGRSSLFPQAMPSNSSGNVPNHRHRSSQTKLRVPLFPQLRGSLTDISYRTQGYMPSHDDPDYLPSKTRLVESSFYQPISGNVGVKVGGGEMNHKDSSNAVPWVGRKIKNTVETQRPVHDDQFPSAPMSRKQHP